MSALLLVRHSLVEGSRDVPRTQWPLSAEGRARCAWLAAELAERAVTRLYSSVEPKASETARLAGALIGVQAAPRMGLHENDRTGLDFLAAPELRARIQLFFEQPDTFIMGLERAQDALLRFSAAVTLALAEARGANTAIVAHGAIISLFVARHNTVPVFQFWNYLGAPAYVALDAQTFAFDGTIHNCPH